MNEIKIRYVHPEELINLTEDAKNYFLDLRSKDIINYDDSYNSISYDSVFWKDEQADII